MAEAIGAISLFGAGETGWGGADDIMDDVADKQSVVVPAPISIAPVSPPVLIHPRSRFDLSALPRITRAAQIARTLDQACADDRFCDHVARADAARDTADWITAEREYGAALQFYPLHWGYCIQHAHAIKEQGNTLGAEAGYRSAVALGAPADMVDQHLFYVARLNGAMFVRRSMPDLDVAPLHAPPTLHDIRLLGQLARVPAAACEDLALPLLRGARDNRAVLVPLIAMPEFARVNRTFLEILRG